MKRLAIVEYVMSAGGVERVLQGLSRAFLDLPEARAWEITLLLSRYNSANRRCEWPAELTGPNLRVEWLGERSAASRFLDPLVYGQGIGARAFARKPVMKLARKIRRKAPRAWRAWLGDRSALIAEASSRFDLMYFTYPVQIPAPPVRIPIVATPQDFNFKHFTPPSSTTHRTQDRNTRSWLDRSTRLLLSSAAVGDELARFYPEYAAKAEVVRLGIDTGCVAPAADELEKVRVERRLPPQFVLVAGWVIPHKNQLAVVEAAAALRARGRSVPIVFVGPNATDLADTTDSVRRSSYAIEVRAAMARHGLVAGRDYLALGYVSDAELQCIYRLATVVAVPSLYEGFGLPGLEAMRAGCPIVYASIPPLEEQNQLLGGIIPMFDPKDPAALAAQLEWILTHPADVRASAAVAARLVPEVYDWRKTARAYLEAFDRILAAPAC